jgi:hypothetical protein
MGVDVELYRARIGTFYGVRMRMTLRGSKEVDGKIWFIGLVLAVLLVVGGVEMNPVPQAELDKIDQILAHVKNQERETKVIQQRV